MNNTPWDWSDFYSELENKSPAKEPEKMVSCSHEWMPYLGLNESFNYCKKCDAKDNDN